MNGSSFKFYSLIWIVIILIHGAVLYLYYGYPIWVAVADSLTFNLIFAAMAPGFWYVVRFASLADRDYLYLLGAHLAAGTIAVLIWTSLSKYILQLLFSGNSDYLRFLVDSNVWRMIIGIMYYSITVLIFYLLRYYMDLQERANRELELSNLLKDSELKMLKSQINPHFIFNSLNSISALTVSKPESAREMVIKLSDFLRYSLGKDSIQMNTLEQEIQNVGLYLDIEKVRFGSKLNFEQSIDEQCMQVKVPNLILQPLFENAIKYGVYESIEDVVIRLNCEPKDNLLHLTVSNNFDEESVTSRGEGIGLENVKKRLSLVYGKTDLLEINKQNNVFTVLLKIPTKTNHE